MSCLIFLKGRTTHLLILFILEHTYLLERIIVFFLTGYGIRDTELGAVVTAYEPHTPDDFISALRESVTQIRTVIS